MKPFRLFLSHCDQQDHPLIRCLYDLLEEAFRLEIRAGTIEISYDGKEGVAPGNALRQTLVNKVSECDLVLACPFRRWRQAKYFQEEIRAAFAKHVPIIPILFLGPNDDVSSVQLGDLDPRFEEDDGRLVLSAVLIHYENAVDPVAVRDAIRKDVGSTLGGQLIAQIRNAISERASRDLTILDSSDQFLHDLSTHPSNFINMFLYDGGKTVRQICSKSEVLQYLQQTASLQIKFLYVDTDFKPFVSETDEFRQIPELEQIDERLYAPLYEALIRKSGMVHNESPKGHKFDVNRSVRALRELSRKFGFKLEVKKTSQLPFYRTVLTRQYAYYTQLLPTFSEAAQDEGAPEYYSLRISAKSPVGLALSKHYDRLWDNASAHIE